MKDDNEYVIVGKISVPYGIQGWIKIVSFTEVMTDLLRYKPWYLESESGWQLVKPQHAKAHGKQLIAKFNEYHTPEAVRVLTGKKIAVTRSQLPVLGKNEYYWSDLQGLTVIDQQGNLLGKVAYLLATGSNDVLVVKNEAGIEHAIPYLPDSIIMQVDLASKTIQVDWE